MSKFQRKIQAIRTFNKTNVYLNHNKQKSFTKQWSRILNLFTNLKTGHWTPDEINLLNNNNNNNTTATTTATQWGCTSFPFIFKQHVLLLRISDVCVCVCVYVCVCVCMRVYACVCVCMCVYVPRENLSKKYWLKLGQKKNDAR